MKSNITSWLLALAVIGAAAPWALGQVAATNPTQPAPGTQPALPAAPRSTVEVPVRRVVLFTSGVGFFQHQGTVKGNAETELRFKTEQINDILKSLLVSDRDAGLIKSITYPSLDPVSRTLRSFQIDISGNPPLAEILRQMRGSKVSVSVMDETVEGTILGVEEKDRPVGKGDSEKILTSWHVNLITANGIRTVNLDDVKKLDVKDETLQKEIGQALAALAHARDRDKKPVIIHFDGAGERRVAIGYLVETPIWKTSYRLILPELDSKDQAKLLGWAIVENQTDNDWTDVSLDLVGGRPISFIENLYQPLYVPRPVVQPKSYASLRPQTYDEAMDEVDPEKIMRLPSEMVAAGGVTGGAVMVGGGAGGGGGGMFQNSNNGGNNAVRQGLFQAGGAVAPDAAAKAPDAPADFTQGVASIANAAKVGEMFQYSVKDVNLPRQRSAMIPIITEAIDFDRVSIYNQSVLAKNPLHGVRLKNKTGKYLLSGPITVLDMVKGTDGNVSQGYAGDARIDDVPLGQDRLLSYGVDQDLIADAAAAESSDSLMTGSIVKGVLHLKFKTLLAQEYTFQNKAAREKSIVIEHPLSAGYDLKEPEKPLEKTDTLYRFQTKVGAKATGKFTVRQERIRWEEVSLLPMDIPALETYTKYGAIPQKVKDILAKAAEMRRGLFDLDRKRSAKEADRARDFEEQRNIRENIKVFEKGTKSYEDAVKDLVAKDAELKDLNKSIKDLQTQSDAARAELENFIVNTSVE